MEEDYGTKYEWNTFKMIMIKWSWFNKQLILLLLLYNGKV